MAGRDDLDPIQGFIDEFGVGGFAHIVDETGSIWANFEIVSQPSFIFIDASGEAETHLGALGIDGLTDRLDRLTQN